MYIGRLRVGRRRRTDVNFTIKKMRNYFADIVIVTNFAIITE